MDGQDCASARLSDQAELINQAAIETNSHHLSYIGENLSSLGMERA